MKEAGLFIAVVLAFVLDILLRSAAGIMGSYGMHGFGSNSFSTVFSLVLWALTTGGGMLLIVWHARNANHASLIAPASRAAHLRNHQGSVWCRQPRSGGVT